MARDGLTERRMATLRSVLGRRQLDLHVVVENLIDPHNASAIVRTADGFGVGVVDYVFWKTTVPKVSVDVARGTKRWTVIQRFRSFEAFDADRRARGLRLVVTADGDVEGCVAHTEYDWTQPTAVVFGNEKEGSDPAVFRAADAVVTIPMLGFARSFNVSVAAAVLLSEVASGRRRGYTSTGGTSGVSGRFRPGSGVSSRANRGTGSRLPPYHPLEVTTCLDSSAAARAAWWTRARPCRGATRRSRRRRRTS